PSRKRCRSLDTNVTSSIYVTRALVPSCADLLPPRKRFRDSISPEDSVEEDIDVDELADIKADATAVEVVVDRDVMTRVDAEADPSESSPPPVSVAPMVSPFLCSNDSGSDTEMPERHVSPTPLDVMLTRFLLSPVVAPPRIRRRRAMLIRPEEDIPIGRLYGTHPGGPCRALTTRKSVRPLPSHCLALRYTSHHLDHFTSRSSSGHSFSDHSSSGHSISGHSLFRHASPDTTVADSSTPPRFIYPPLARTPRCSKAYLCWRSAPLSTMSLDTNVTSSIYVTRALVPSCADFLPPRKRFRDSISPEDSVEEDIDVDELVDIKADATAVEVVVDRDVMTRVDAGIGMEVDVVSIRNDVAPQDRSPPIYLEPPHLLSRCHHRPLRTDLFLTGLYLTGLLLTRLLLTGLLLDLHFTRFTTLHMELRSVTLPFPD
nr:hypothetical protein [Tanacetum cinerariifolium]